MIWEEHGQQWNDKEIVVGAGRMLYTLQIEYIWSCEMYK